MAEMPALSQSKVSGFLRRMVRHRLMLTGFIIMLLMLFVAAAGRWVAPYDPLEMNFAKTFQPPSLEHPFGTDNFGRDIMSRVIHGAAISLRVALLAVAFAGILGTFLGAVAGYYGGWIDEVIMRIADILFAFPAVLLAITVMAILGRGVENAMIAIGIVYTPIFTRVTRGSVLTVRNTDFVDAARALGRADTGILLGHVLPNAMAPITVQTSLSLAFAILAESALSFFGLGNQPPTPSWGLMLAEGRGFLSQAPWMGIFPGLAIMLTVMGFNFFGDGLRDLLDPRLKRILGPQR